MRHLTFVLFFLPVPALADGTCSFAAHADLDSRDDPAIHADPSADSAVLGAAPSQVPEGEQAIFGAEFTVLAMQDGWARISNVTNFDRSKTAPDGWIDGKRVGLIAQTEMAFAAADTGSDVVWSGQNWPYAIALLDCDGEWALIRFDDIQLEGTRPVIKGSVTGWVRGVCALQETTCDGTYGDRLPG